jgi:hypothetical protein
MLFLRVRKNVCGIFRKLFYAFYVISLEEEEGNDEKKQSFLAFVGLEMFGKQESRDSDNRFTPATQVLFRRENNLQLRVAIWMTANTYLLVMFFRCNTESIKYVCCTKITAYALQQWLHFNDNSCRLFQTLIFGTLIIVQDVFLQWQQRL